MKISSQDHRQIDGRYALHWAKIGTRPELSRQFSISSQFVNLVMMTGLVRIETDSDTHTLLPRFIMQ